MFNISCIRWYKTLDILMGHLSGMETTLNILNLATNTKSKIIHLMSMKTLNRSIRLKNLSWIFHPKLVPDIE